MSKATFNLSGTWMAIVIAVVFFAIALLTFPYASNMFSALEHTSERLTFAQVVVSLLGFIGAISAFTFAIFQYRKAEKWKRMQFVADEVRELEADPKIQNALLMVDWGARKINLYLVPEPKPEDLVKITREVQWRALLPHTIKHDCDEYLALADKGAFTTTGEIRPERDRGFNVTEALIRDTYDAFLTRLDRLETFIDAGLISARDLRPFIAYWVNALTQLDGTGDSATWRFTLLTYIDFYQFTGVNSLFARYGKNIDADGKIFNELMTKVPDRHLAERLAQAARQDD